VRREARAASKLLGYAGPVDAPNLDREESAN